MAAHFGAGSPGHLHFVDAILRNLGPILAGQVAVAAFVALAAWNLLRLRPWARIAVEGICWASIAIVGSFTVLFVVSWERAAAGVPGEQAARMRVWGPVVAVCAALLVGGLLGTVIWFLRRPAVRRAFRPAPDVSPSAP